jgi:hypothetical protein
MRVKDIIKLLTIGDTVMANNVKEQLKQIGFSQIPECLKECGVLIWEVDYNYEVYIEYPRGKERRYSEGVEKIMEIIGEGFYGEVYRVIPCKVYIIHLAVSFDEYYNVQIIDKEEMEEVGFLQVSEGFIYCGDQDDVSKAISQLIAITPAYIKVY